MHARFPHGESTASFVNGQSLMLVDVDVVEVVLVVVEVVLDGAAVEVLVVLVMELERLVVELVVLEVVVLDVVPEVVVLEVLVLVLVLVVVVDPGGTTERISTPPVTIIGVSSPNPSCRTLNVSSPYSSSPSIILLNVSVFSMLSRGTLKSVTTLPAVKLVTET